MTTENHTTLGGPIGATHTGSGPQTNLNFLLGAENLLDPAALLTGRATRRFRTFTDDEPARLRARFAAPPGLQAARRRLGEHGTVLLHGAPGTGKHTAGVALLSENSSATGRLHRLDGQASGDERALDPGLVEEGDRLLLDLTGVDTARKESLLTALPSFRAEVRSKSAILAVALPDTPQRLIPSALLPCLAPLQRPDPWRALRMHLRADGIHPRPDDLRDAWLADFLAHAAMADVAALAAGALHARERPGSGTTHCAQWLREALDTLTPGSADIRPVLAGLPDAGSLSLYLCTALLEGARSDVVERATERLLSAVGHPRLDTPLLHRRALSDRLADLKGTVHADGTVHLPDGHAAAVREYFWTNYPALRDTLGTWAEKTVDADRVGPADRYALIERFAEQTLRTDRPDVLVRLVESWTESRESAEPRYTTARASSAGKALTLGLLDERHGGYFRRRTYEWSRSSGTGPRLAEVLVEVCARVLAADYPHQALVRLLHLARRQRGPAGRKAQEALARLTADDHRLFRRLLAQLTDAHGADRASDIRLFLALVAPERPTDTAPRYRTLLSDGDVRRRLTDGWDTVWRLLPERDRAGALRTWLDTALEEPDTTGDRLLGILVNSCRGRGTDLSRLHLQVRQRSAGHPRGPALFEKFWERCAVALGLEPAPREKVPS
ncbi:hypothetical protein [Streptomyces cacaoi]|uniref:hypothetical protein n=1 Tax=Streptomyces cacaoi TaxID=1898 RepID=UPI0037490D90